MTPAPHLLLHLRWLPNRLNHPVDEHGAHLLARLSHTQAHVLQQGRVADVRSEAVPRDVGGPLVAGRVGVASADVAGLQLLELLLDPSSPPKMADKLRAQQQLEQLQARYVGTGHADTTRYEWTSNVARDSLSSYVGHAPLLQYMALGMGESREKVRAMLIDRMIQPVGKPPEVQE